MGLRSGAGGIPQSLARPQSITQEKLKKNMIVKQQPNLLLLPKPEIIKDTTFRYNFMGLVISTRFFQRGVNTAFSGIKIQCIKKL